MVITSECLSLIYFVSFRQSHKVDDKQKYGKVVKITNVTRGKSLIDSHWVKLKYKTGILERYYTRIVVKERVPSKGWFRPFELRKDDFDLLNPLPWLLSCWCSVNFCNHCYPWILHLWLRYSVCLLSVLLYLYRNESVKSDSRISSQGWWVSRVVVRNLRPQPVDESFLLSSPRSTHSNWT